MKRASLLTFVFLTAGAVALWGQEGGGASGSGGGNQGGGNQGGGNQGGGNQGGGRGNQGQGRQPQDPFGQQGQQQQQAMPRPIFLSGQVVLDNGLPPPEPVTIERVCHGQNVPETYTDTKGRFSFQVGGDQTLAIADASSSGFGGPGGFGGAGGGIGGTGFGGARMGDGPGMGVDLTGCEIRAALPGFRSESISLGRRRSMDNPDIGVIVLHPLGGQTAEAIVSVTSLQAPKDAQKAYDKAMRELSKKNGSNPEKVLKELEKAVEVYPDYAAAWSMLGETKARMGDNEGAEQALERSVAADPKYMRPYPALLRIHLDRKNWDRTEELCDAMLSVSPSYTQAHYFLALAQFQQGNHDDALVTARRIQDGDGADEYPQTHQMIGMIHSARGSFSEAAKEYRTYLELQPDASSAEAIKKQLNEWEVLGVVQPAQ